MAVPRHHRHTEREALKRNFWAGNNILMLAPRRIGKTWLLKTIAEDMSGEGWNCILVDVEGMSTEEEFLRALCQEIEKTQAIKERVVNHLSQRFKAALGNMDDQDLRQAVTKIDPRQFLETLIESLNGSGKKTLILIDEIALFILERARIDVDGTKRLLYHLRKIQQANPNVLWFMTGSIGLDAISQRHGMQGALLGYDIFEIDPFTPVEALSYVEELVASGQGEHTFKFEGDAFDHLATALGWLSPYYLRQITRQIIPSVRSSVGVPLLASRADVDRAVSILLSPAQKIHFSPWEEHIHKNFNEEESRTLAAILNAVCEHTDGETEATIITVIHAVNPRLNTRAFKDLMICLQKDGYLSKKDDRWYFRSGLVRRYWLEYVKP